MTAPADRHRMTGFAAVFLTGAAPICTGLVQRSPTLPRVGAAICLGGFAWRAPDGWLAPRRRARAMRDGRDA